MTPSDFYIQVLTLLQDRDDKNNQKLGLISEKMSELAAVAIEQKGILEEHIRRSEANERLVEISLNKAEDLKKKLEDRIMPLEKQAMMWAGVGKALIVLGTLVGIFGAISKFIFP
jgi:hypothetical protein